MMTLCAGRSDDDGVGTRATDDDVVAVAERDDRCSIVPRLGLPT